MADLSAAEREGFDEMDRQYAVSLLRSRTEQLATMREKWELERGHADELAAWVERLRDAIDSILGAASRGTASASNECAYCPTIKVEAAAALAEREASDG